MAKCEKNPSLARSQTAAIPDAWSAHATIHDMAWWWLLTRFPTRHGAT
jgi:hypothetical protein